MLGFRGIRLAFAFRIRVKRPKGLCRPYRAHVYARVATINYSVICSLVLKRTWTSSTIVCNRGTKCSERFVVPKHVTAWEKSAFAYNSYDTYTVPCLRSNRSRLGSRYTYVRIILARIIFPPFTFPSCMHVRTGDFGSLPGWRLKIVGIYFIVIPLYNWWDARVLEFRTVKLNILRYGTESLGRATGRRPFKAAPVCIWVRPCRVRDVHLNVELRTELRHGQENTRDRVLFLGPLRSEITCTTADN